MQWRGTRWRWLPEQEENSGAKEESWPPPNKVRKIVNEEIVGGQRGVRRKETTSVQRKWNRKTIKRSQGRPKLGLLKSQKWRNLPLAVPLKRRKEEDTGEPPSQGKIISAVSSYR